MSGYQSSDQVRERYQAALGDSLGRAYYSIKNDYINTLVYWRLYRSLFGSAPEVVSLLNQTSGFFFGSIQAVLFEMILLRISRFSDRPAHGKIRSANLSLSRLAQDSPDAFRDELEAIFRECKDKCEAIVRQRNKKIAHLDFDVVALGEPIPGVSRRAVSEYLKVIGDFLYRFEFVTMRSHASFDVIVPGDDEIKFLRLLYYGSQCMAQVDGRPNVENAFQSEITEVCIKHKLPEFIGAIDRTISDDQDRINRLSDG